MGGDKYIIGRTNQSQGRPACGHNINCGILGSSLKPSIFIYVIGRVSKYWFVAPLIILRVGKQRGLSRVHNQRINMPPLTRFNSDTILENTVFELMYL
jgi:hypothetical protein